MRRSPSTSSLASISSVNSAASVQGQHNRHYPSQTGQNIANQHHSVASTKNINRTISQGSEINSQHEFEIKNKVVENISVPPQKQNKNMLQESNVYKQAHQVSITRMQTMETEIEMETDIKYDQQNDNESINGEPVASADFVPRTQKKLNTEDSKQQDNNQCLIEYLQNISLPSFADEPCPPLDLSLFSSPLMLDHTYQDVGSHFLNTTLNSVALSTTQVSMQSQLHPFEQVIDTPHMPTDIDNQLNEATSSETLVNKTNYDQQTDIESTAGESVASVGNVPFNQETAKTEETLQKISNQMLLEQMKSQFPSQQPGIEVQQTGKQAIPIINTSDLEQNFLSETETKQKDQQRREHLSVPTQGRKDPASICDGITGPVSRPQMLDLKTTPNNMKSQFTNRPYVPINIYNLSLGTSITNQHRFEQTYDPHPVNSPIQSHYGGDYSVNPNEIIGCEAINQSEKTDNSRTGSGKSLIKSYFAKMYY